MIVLMPKQSRLLQPGFSFVEIMITLLIVGLLVSFVVPSFIRRGQHDPRRVFCAQFTQLMQEAVMSALARHKIQQVFFDIGQRKVSVTIEQEGGNQAGKSIVFVPLEPKTEPQPIIIPEEISIVNFFINGIDDIAGRGQVTTIWFYIMPDGTCQPIVLNMQRTDKDAHFSLVINPFYGQVTEYDTFQKP